MSQKGGEIALMREGLMKRRILIADDNASFLQSVAGFLASDPDCEVVGKAEDGQRAVEQAAQLLPDLVLIDLKMPRMNGLVATKQIKSSHNPPQVVIVTLYDNEEYRKAALDVGADAYIVKSEFTSQIGEFLKRLPVLSAPVHAVR